MRSEFRLVLNCILVAALTVGGIFASLLLPLTPMLWIAEHFNASANEVIWSWR